MGSFPQFGAARDLGKARSEYPNRALMVTDVFQIASGRIETGRERITMATRVALLRADVHYQVGFRPPGVAWVVTYWALCSAALAISRWAAASALSSLAARRKSLARLLQCSVMPGFA